MKRILSFLPKKAWFAVISLAVMFGIAAAVQAGFGPDRPTFTMAKPASYNTFNSITDNPVIGDERAFFRGALPGASKFSDPVTGAKDGQEVTLEIFVHNDAAANLNLVAKDTQVRVALPTGSKQAHTLKAFVNSSNSKPTEVFDTLDITGANNGFFELEYVKGSAKLKNNHFTNSVALSDSIVTTGATIGYDKLNGNVPGCAHFAGWVTLKAKVKMPHYTIQKSIRLAG
jgi:hypothetical protein